jgi:hypothetical protein
VSAASTAGCVERSRRKSPRPSATMKAAAVGGGRRLQGRARAVRDERIRHMREI